MSPQAKVIAKFGAAGAISLAAFIGGHEGLRLETYLDYGGIPTACFGETKGIKVGMTFTKGQCEAMLYSTIATAFREVENCTRDDLPPNVLAAFSSFVYNVGAAKFCQSTMARYAKAGLYEQACQQFGRWTFVGGKDCKIRSNLCNGIVIRRKEEQQLCEGHYG